MNMTIVDVVNIVYPGQIQLRNVTFGQDRNEPISITKWEIPGVPEPTVSELEAMIPGLQSQFDLQTFLDSGQMQLAKFVDSTAQERKYDSAISCASYVASTILAWKDEATAFVSWRDSIFSYTIAQVQLMQSGQRSIPTFEEFKNELPAMAWPD